jgi:hypothetical protein
VGDERCAEHARELAAIARARRGDVGGLEVLVRRHQVRALRAAYLVTLDFVLKVTQAISTVAHRFRTGGMHPAPENLPTPMGSAPGGRQDRSADSSTRIVASDEVALSQLGEGSSRRGGGQRSST